MKKGGKGKRKGGKNTPGSAAKATLAPTPAKREPTKQTPAKATGPETRAKAQASVGPKDETWAQVVGRKRGKQAQADPPPRPTPAPTGAAAKAPKSGPKRRLPRTSTIVLNCPKGQCQELMAVVRAKIKLVEVGLLGGILTKTEATGALIIEVPGPDYTLTDKMRNVLNGREGVRIDRPVRTAEVRIRGLDDSVRPEEAVEALAEKGGCTRAEISAGDIRSAQRGQGSPQARLPLATAKKAVEGGFILVG